MKKIKLNPHVFQVLNNLKEHGLNPILAGGAIRDSVLDKPIKDYDIYTSVDISPQELRRTIVINQGDDRLYQVGRGGSEHYGDSVSNGINNVFNVRKHSLNFQVILTQKDPIDIINDEFGIGLSKCYMFFNGKSWQISFTSDFINDMKNKTLTICQSPSIEYKTFEKTLTEYAPRIQKKYPNYPIKVSSQLQPLYQQYLERKNK